MDSYTFVKHIFEISVYYFKIKRLHINQKMLFLKLKLRISAILTFITLMFLLFK